MRLKSDHPHDDSLVHMIQRIESKPLGGCNENSNTTSFVNINSL